MSWFLVHIEFLEQGSRRSAITCLKVTNESLPLGDTELLLSFLQREWWDKAEHLCVVLGDTSAIEVSVLGYLKQKCQTW